jgi:hypothetical protein
MIWARLHGWIEFDKASAYNSSQPVQSQGKVGERRGTETGMGYIVIKAGGKETGKNKKKRGARGASSSDKTSEASWNEVLASVHGFTVTEPVITG